MAGLQRSSMSFRRQGSSGLVFDDRFLSELNQMSQNQQKPQGEEQKAELKEGTPSRTVGSINTLDGSRSNGGGRGFRTDKVSPAVEPPSPRVSACGLCSAFGKPEKNRRPPKPRKQRFR